MKGVNADTLKAGRVNPYSGESFVPLLPNKNAPKYLLKKPADPCSHDLPSQLRCTHSNRSKLLSTRENLPIPFIFSYRNFNSSGEKAAFLKVQPANLHVFSAF